MSFNPPQVAPQATPQVTLPAPFVTPMSNSPFAAPIKAAGVPQTALPQTLPSVPPAVAARQRKDRKKDTERKVGAQVLKSTSQGGSVPSLPTPPPPPTLQAPPPETLPKPVTAQYERPKQGVSYLAMGLNLLFPGSPAASLVSSVAAGMARGAENRYQRDEQQAQDQNQYAIKQAEIDQRNAQAKVDTANANARNQYQYQTGMAERAMELRKQGLDVGGRPIPPPPALSRVLPPGVNREPTPADYVNHYAQLASWYDGIGATSVGASYRQQAQEAQRQQAEADTNRRTLAIAEANIKDREMLAGMREAGEDRRERDRELSEDRRAQYVQSQETQRLFLAAGLRSEAAENKPLTTQQRSSFAQRGAADLRQYNAQLDQLTKPQVDKFGRPIEITDPLTKQKTQAPAVLTPGDRQTLSGAVSQVLRSRDPIGMATVLAGTLDMKPAAQDLLLRRAQAQDAMMQAQGQRPQYMTADQISKVTAATRKQLEAEKAKTDPTYRLMSLGADGQSAIDALKRGVSIDDMIRQVQASSKPPGEKKALLDALNGVKASQPAAAEPTETDNTSGFDAGA